MKKRDLSEYPHIRNIDDPAGFYQLMKAFIEDMRVKNYSEKTCEDRELFLLLFLEWAGQRGLTRPTEINRQILGRYQRHLFLYRKKDGNPLSFRSQYNRLTAIRSWFRWLTKQNHILYNPASEIELPKLEKRLPKAILNESEVEVILNYPDIKTAMGLRNRAILEVLYSTGIRRSELINLMVQDIDNERGTLFVRQGKGRKDRMIPIGERAIMWVEKYLDEVRPGWACGLDENKLFINQFGHPIKPGNLSSNIRKIIQKSGVKKSGSCHLFRHTMATLMLEHGASMRYIQAMLGHVKLDTTQIYTQVSIKKLKEIHTLTHPADRRNSYQNLKNEAEKEEKNGEENEKNIEENSGKAEPEATEEALFKMLNEEKDDEDDRD